MLYYFYSYLYTKNTTNTSNEEWLQMRVVLLTLFHQTIYITSIEYKNCGKYTHFLPRLKMTIPIQTSIVAMILLPVKHWFTSDL